MKRPTSRRENPKHRRIATLLPEGIDLVALAGRVRYVGSPYHKDVPSFAGPIPQPRPDATISPRELTQHRDKVQDLLQRAITNGWVGEPWEEGFPRYVWVREGNTIFEGRLTNQTLGEYKGYPLTQDQEVQGLP